MPEEKFSLAERLRLAGIAAPLFRAGVKDRRLKVIDASGKVVREATIADLAEWLSLRAGVEFAVTEAIAKRFCNDCKRPRLDKKKRESKTGLCRSCLIKKVTRDRVSAQTPDARRAIAAIGGRARMARLSAKQRTDYARKIRLGS